MLLSPDEITKLVDECILKMSRLKMPTFWKCYCESIYRVTKPFTSNVEDDVNREARTRIPEFEDSWALNLYQIQESKR